MVLHLVSSICSGVAFATTRLTNLNDDVISRKAKGSGKGSKHTSRRKPQADDAEDADDEVCNVAALDLSSEKRCLMMRETLFFLMFF
jgi:hypothetical protein